MPSFLSNIGPTELIIVFAILFLIFGRKVLMGFGRTGGETLKEIKKIKKNIVEAVEDEPAGNQKGES
jgi:Sec-independent protein translocase protein TatA